MSLVCVRFSNCSVVFRMPVWVPLPLVGSARRVLYRRLFVIRLAVTFILSFPSGKFPTC